MRPNKRTTTYSTHETFAELLRSPSKVSLPLTSGADPESSSARGKFFFYSASRAANWKLEKKGTAIFQSTGRLMDDELPAGVRSNHVYQSPHFKPHSSFNYWNDLNHNQSVRNKWDNKSSSADLIEDFDIISGRKLVPAKSTTSDLISMRSEAPVKHLETSMVTSFNP